MQVPSHVEYERATSVDHALELLARPDTRVLAGGHSLIPMMKLRLAQPEVLVDINDLAELAFIRVTGGQLCIGALTRHAELLDSGLAGELFPIFHDAERVVADPVVRLWGTVGGSLCQADPSEDLSAVFAAARATAVIRGRDGAREIPVREFHLGPYQTAVGPGELLAEIRVPVRPGTGSAYQKVARRVGDWSIAAVGAVLRLDGEPPVIAEAGLGLTAVGAARFVAAEAEEFLRGQTPGEPAFTAAAKIAAEHCRPVADQRGPQDYKRHLVGELAARALRLAAERARAGAPT
jgi:carbon-monoxide dehydrogenase medium subunit